MKKLFTTSSLIILFAFLLNQHINACSCFIVSKSASTDGSTFMTYTFDMHTHAGELYYLPAGTHSAGTMKKIYQWDTGKYLGEISEAAHTYSVVGNMNELQVAMNETTYGGREELVDSTGVFDYGGLIFTTLQRATSAREAIRIMNELVTDYGYYSSGETYTVLDKNEVWIVDFIGKGSDEKGAVWVARRVPDGYVCGHANQSRITTFPLADGKISITSKEWDKLNLEKLECIYAYDVIPFARKKGYFEGKDKDFSFADAYAPLSFDALRFCEARVWSMFDKVNSNMKEYLPYAMGESKEHRMPLWVKPDKKISVQDVMGVMRTHYEGSPMDMTKDVGAGPYHCPYRWRPMTWKVEEDKGEEKAPEYLFERAISTQQTAFTSIAQGRNWLPDPIGGVLWFGVDDTYSTVYTPMYCAIKAIPGSYAESKNRLINFDLNHVHWSFNLVANLAYTRYNVIIEDVKKVQHELESKFIASQPAVDKAATELYKISPELAKNYLTDYSVSQGELTAKRWKELAGYIIVKYIDGNIKKEKNGEFQLNEYGNVAFPNQPGYEKPFYEKVVKELGDGIKVKKIEGEIENGH